MEKKIFEELEEIYRKYNIYRVTLHNVVFENGTAWLVTYDKKEGGLEKEIRNDRFSFVKCK